MSGTVFQFMWEVELIVWIQNNIMTLPGMNFITILFTYFGEPIASVAVIGFLYWSYDKKMGKHVALNVLLTGVSNPMIKNTFFRIRPYMANDNIKCLKALESDADLYDIKAQGYSFPSGHAMNVTSIFSSINTHIKNKKLLIISIFIIFMTCCSRFSLGVHYPSDVIVGIIVGLSITLLSNLLQRKFDYNKILIVLSLILSLGFLYCKSDDYFSCYGIFLGYTFGSLYEEKFVHFDNTRNKLKMFLRVVVGALIFLGVSEIMKLPLSDDFLHSGSLISYLYRTFRYTVSTFACIGLFPMIFKKNILNLKDN